MLKLVKREDIKQDAWIKPDGLDYCLDCWKIYMGKDDRDLSSSRMTFGGGVQDNAGTVGYESDPYIEQRRADLRIGEAAGAEIEEMKEFHRWAIYMKCGIATVWRFPNSNFMDVAVAASEELTRKLKLNVATRIYF